MAEASSRLSETVELQNDDSDALTRWPSVERRWSALLAATPDLLFWMSPDGHYLGSHAARPELLFAPPDVFIGRHISEILPTDVAEPVLNAIEAAAKNGTVERVEYDLDLPIGRCTFEARIVATDDEITAIVRDVTSEANARHELMRQAEQIQEQAAREIVLLREANNAEMHAREERAERIETVARLAAGVAHDFNNLLGVILNYHSVLDRSALDTVQRTDLAAANEAAETAARLVGRILATGSPQPLSGSCDLNVVVAANVDLLGPTLPATATMTFEGTNGPSHVDVNPDAVGQVREPDQ